MLNIWRCCHSDLLKSCEVVPQLIFINPFLKICSEFVQDFINFILFAALKINDSICDFFGEICWIFVRDLNDLISLVWISHHTWVQDVEFGEVKVVMIHVEQLEGLFLVHMAASEPDATVVTLDWCWAHDEGAEFEIVIKILLFVFALIVLALRFTIKRQWCLYFVNSLNFPRLLVFDFLALRHELTWVSES